MRSMLRVLSFPKRLKSFHSDENNIIRKLPLQVESNKQFFRQPRGVLTFIMNSCLCLLLALRKLKSPSLAVLKYSLENESTKSKFSAY